MKPFKFLYKTIMSVAVVCAAMALSGCDFMHEELPPCERKLRLKMYYDYNMKFADALPAEVKYVSVYVFDAETGEGIDEIHVPVGEVKEREFEIKLDHLPYAVYDILVWCFGESDEHFTVKPNRGAENLQRYHSCLMNQDKDRPGFLSEDIGRLYHGQLLDADCTQEKGDLEFEIPLIKNTNTVRVVLQQLNGEFLDPDNFDISLESDNGHMDYDNNLIAGHTRVYQPWAIESGITGMGKNASDTRTITSVSALVAEHTIGRIIPETGVKLRVRNKETGEEIINIPFVDYALLVKGNYNRPMSDQEYLDRQDEYNLVFFLDHNLRWLNQYIYINSWRIVLQNNDL